MLTDPISPKPLSFLLFKSVCQALSDDLNSSLDAIVDTTYGGKASEGLKSLAMSLGMPIVSLTSGSDQQFR